MSDFERRPTASIAVVRTSRRGTTAKSRRAAVLARARENGDDVEERDGNVTITAKRAK